MMPSFEDVALNIIRVIFFSILTTDDYCIVQYSSHHFSVFQLIPSILSPAVGHCRQVLQPQRLQHHLQPVRRFHWSAFEVVNVRNQKEINAHIQPQFFGRTRFNIGKIHHKTVALSAGVP